MLGVGGTAPVAEKHELTTATYSLDTRLYEMFEGLGQLVVSRRGHYPRMLGEFKIEVVIDVQHAR